MVYPHLASEMGQAGLCSVSAPVTESLSPLASGNSFENHLNAENYSQDLQDSINSMLENSKDYKSSDIILKLQSVVAENIQLKDTIVQNNLALRHQINLLVQWNQQVVNHEREFRKTINDLNKKLSSTQQENYLLRSTLASKKPGSEPTDTKYQEWHDAIQSLNKQVEQENIKLMHALEEKETYLNQRTKLEGEITLLKCDLTASMSESRRLHVKTCELSKINNNLQQRLKEIEKINALECKGDQSALIVELHECQHKVTFLESELKLAESDVSKYKTRYNELSAMKLDINTNEPNKDKNETENNSEFLRLKEESAMLREEVDTLETALSNERKRTNEERSSINRIYVENNQLKSELQNFKDKVDKNEYTDQYYQAKIRSIHEQHDEATAKLVSYEELLGSKNDEIARYKKELGQTKAQLAEMKSEGETIAVLRAQVDVYQSDFRAERDSRESIATDREKLKDEIRHLQARYTQVVDELESYQRHQFKQGNEQSKSPRSISEEPSIKLKDNSALNPDVLWENLSSSIDKKDDKKTNTGEEFEVDENLLYCPKCNKSFVQLRPLEEHVNKCLDEE